MTEMECYEWVRHRVTRLMTLDKLRFHSAARVAQCQLRHHLRKLGAK